MQNDRAGVAWMSNGRHADVTTQTETETKNKNTSSRIDAQTARATERQQTAALAEIHWLDAFAITACTLRPDWNPAAVRAVIARTRGSRETVARRVLTVALDPDQRTPLGIENADMRAYEATAVPMGITEWRNAERCPNGAIHDPWPCPLCRMGVIA